MIACIPVAEAFRPSRRVDPNRWTACPGASSTEIRSVQMAHRAGGMLSSLLGAGVVLSVAFF